MSKNISGTFFVLFQSLSTFFLPFYVILTCKYINHTYSVAVYTLNLRSNSYSLFLTAENVPSTFHSVVWPSKHQIYLWSNFKISTYVRQYIARCLFPSKQVISAVLWHFDLYLHQPGLSSCSFAWKKTTPSFILGLHPISHPFTADFELLKL